MIIFADALGKFADIADIGYFVIGIVVYYAVSKVYKGANVKENKEAAISTITILQNNIAAVKEAAEIKATADAKVIERLEKQLDDVTTRNTKLEDQIRTLSVIPWERQEANHKEVMKAVGEVGTGIKALVDYLQGQPNNPSTTTIKDGKVIVETK
jgi:FtsZ-binding cell division protein ZapB